MNQSGRLRRKRGYGPALLLASGIGLPLAFACTFVVKALDASPLQSDTASAPVIAQVDPGENDGRQAVTVTVEQGEQRTVTSATSGLVTRVDVVPAVPVTDGGVAFVADGLPVTVFVADAPLYRDLDNGATGDDVESTQEFLNRLQYDVLVDGHLGSRTTSAIRAFNRDRGRPQDGSTLRRDSLLWVASDATVPQTVSIQIGSQLSEGSDVYVTSTSPRLVLSGESLEVERTLSVGGVEVPVDAGRTVVDNSEHVVSVIGALAGEASGSGTVRLTVPLQVGIVPATAVVTDAAGVTCLWSSLSSAPTVLTDVTGVWGTVHVPADLVGTAVLVNPRQVREDLRCGS